MSDNSTNSDYQEQVWHVQERNNMHKTDKQDTRSTLNSDQQNGYVDSANVVLSDLRTINENSQFARNINPNRDYGQNSYDLFDPVRLPPLKSSVLPRSSSAESASTASTSNIVVTSGKHQQQYPQCQQQSPQRHDSSSGSITAVSVDDQNIQPNSYTSSFYPHLSSSGSGAPGAITPTNQMDMEITPTPIDPYRDHRNVEERFQIKDILKVQKRVEEKDDPKAVDELLANEMNKLSFQQRETIYEEIHGIDVRNAGIKESPELLSESFQQLEAELQNLRPLRAAFDKSQQLFGATTYLNTEELRIMFLRCDLFDVKRAAERLCDYADLMLEIFGDVALQRRPYVTDLTDLELAVLEAGGYQVLPGRDRAGRRILGNLAFDAPKEFGVLPRLRVSVYIVMSFLDDVETQQKGAVGISWWHNVSVDDFIIRKKVHERINCVPMRLGAYHCCIPSENKSLRVGKQKKDNDGGLSLGMAQFVKAMAVMSVGPQLRPHLRFHTGSVVECIYALQSFGIHSDQIPVNSSTGKLKMKQHLKWLELRRLKEDSVKQHGRKFDRIIECPKQTDVLFGRGRPIMRHPGNAVLRSVVQDKLEEYASAKSKKQTTDVTWEVVRTLKGKYGARFLKEENIENSGLGWIEVSNEIARQKVRIAFRDLRTKIMKTNAAEIGGRSTNDHVGKDGANDNVVKAKRKGEPESLQMTPSTALSSANASFIEPPMHNSSQFAQKTNSSTSLFLGMDGNGIKRQRKCF